MKIKFLYYQLQDVNHIKVEIQKRLNTICDDYIWLEERLNKKNDLTTLQLFNDETLLIVPANYLEYPLNSQFRILSLLNLFKNVTKSLNNAFVVLVNNSYSKKVTIFDDIDIRRSFGKVFITGFGPGDPDLLTIKAIKAIENADVIYYDSLINKEFLDKFDVEKIYVGKRKDNHSHSQSEIDEILYQSALNGKNTVRLKGGDPFIFGRGGEEFDYLSQRFVDVEVIPGITSAFGAAAATGISLTQRGISSSVAFCTGYPKEERRIPDADTLVFYMSASILHETAQLLLEKGRSKDTPVALIQNATHKNHKEVYTNLGELSLGNISLPSPIIVIVGSVAINKNYR